MASAVVRKGRIGPANCSVRGLARGFMRGRVGEAFVQHHHDVAAERELNVDRALGSEKVRIAVQMRTEEHAFVRDLAERVETEDLEPARIGKDGTRPRHELMKPAESFDTLVTRAKEQMVGVGKNDFGVEIIEEVTRREGFDGSLRADRHEDGGLDDAVGRVDQPGARTRNGTRRLDFEYESGISQFTFSFRDVQTKAWSVGEAS